ncbi:MAG: leucine-rich repeat protein [Eubacterium sp.]|nr:leucine-rich repeat protein [Eubacterium sp.]
MKNKALFCCAFFRVFFIMIIGIICVLVFNVTAYAADGKNVSDGKNTGNLGCISVDDSEYVIQEGGFLKKESRQGTSSIIKGAGKYSFDAAALTKRITDAWDKGLSEFNVADLKISKDDSSLLNEVYRSTLNDNPDYFFISSGHKYFYDKNSKIINRIQVQYTVDSKTERAAMLKEYAAAITDFKRGVNPSWTDMEKIVYINDYVDRLCEYDESVSLDNIYDVYGVLVKRRAVCQGYSLTVNALAKRLGIESYTVTSKARNHAWNIVKINGKFYMMDATWDDPTTDRLGRARHFYLLKSESWFNSEEGKHAASDYVVQHNVSPTIASDKTYDNYFWNDIDIGFDYINGTWYGLLPDQKAIGKYSCNGRDWIPGEKVIDLSSARWKSADSTYKAVKSVSMFSYDGKIIYSNPDSIQQYDPEKKTSSTLYKLTDSEKKLGCIYGIALAKNGKVRYRLADKPSATDFTIKETSLPAATFDMTMPKVIFKLSSGDYDGLMASLDVYSNSTSCVVTAVDNGAIRSLKYYISDKIIPEEELVLIRESEWKSGSGLQYSFDFKNAGVYIYARAEDDFGNVGYSSIGKFIIDSTAPQIKTVDGKTEFTTETTISISDDNIEAVYVNGVAVTLVNGQLKLSSSKEPYTIRVVDKARNERIITVKVLPETIKDSGVTYQVSSEVVNSDIKQNFNVADKKTSGKYKITKVVRKNGKIAGGTVTYMRPYNKNCKSASVPAVVNIGGVKFKVTAIGKESFKNCKNLKSVVIGKNVKSIETNAFRNCKKLKKITIKSTVLTKIGTNSFKGTLKKPSVILPKKKTEKYKKLLYKAGLNKKAKIISK